jgi:hypothetical protein
MNGGLSVDIFKHKAWSHSNGGVSAFFDEAVIFGDSIEGNISEDDAIKRGVPLLRLIRGPGGNPIATVWLDPDGDTVRGTVGPMFGGTFVGTSDSRFARATGQRGTSVIPLHDRYETVEEYKAFST